MINATFRINEEYYPRRIYCLTKSDSTHIVIILDRPILYYIATIVVYFFSLANNFDKFYSKLEIDVLKVILESMRSFIYAGIYWFIANVYAVKWCHYVHALV